ncbi:hypothetical protein NEPAR04_0734 [Nematocida parisii]|nr:hypothetical protein NEPAR08_0735 [Nematocida parisii]KAI5127610.1 hypothetical protein NEPAR03_1000 [Nematocida parisii]KAI5141163.1 hypothetical protein NEPAR04_0734 [Nematocida parisii]
MPEIEKVAEKIFMRWFIVKNVEKDDFFSCFNICRGILPAFNIAEEIICNLHPLDSDSISSFMYQINLSKRMVMASLNPSYFLYIINNNYMNLLQLKTQSTIEYVPSLENTNI